MGDMLSTGVTGLLAFQTALDTISNNISNVNTPGYSVETANLVDQPGDPDRQRLARAGRYRVHHHAQLQRFSGCADAHRDQQLQPVQHHCADSPTTSTTCSPIRAPGCRRHCRASASRSRRWPTRRARTRRARRCSTRRRAVIAQFQAYQSNLDQLGGQVNTQIQSEASTINSLAQSIASLNQRSWPRRTMAAASRRTLCWISATS